MSHHRLSSASGRRLYSLASARRPVVVAAAAVAAAVHIALGGTADTVAIAWLMALA